MNADMSFRGRLFTILLVVVLLLGGIITAIAFFGARGMVRSLSGEIISQTLAQTQLKLDQFFQPAIRQLRLARDWGNAGLLNADDPRRLNELITPLIRHHPQISSMLIADSRGREHMLLHHDDKWLSRQTRRDEWGDRSHVTEWRDGESPTEQDTSLGYDPRERPWYLGATARAKRPISGAGDPRITDVFWTEPYVFFTTKEAGITAAVTFDPGDGHQHVVGFDVSLAAISEFTTQISVHEHGMVVVLTHDNRIVGLPRYPRFLNPTVRSSALLKAPQELGIPLATNAAEAFASRIAGDDGPLRFISEGDPWWGKASLVYLNEETPLVAVVLVPEEDLLSDVRNMILIMAVIILAVLLIGFERALALSRRLSRPVEAIVELNDRISRGNLEPGPQVQSNIAEIRRLADAQEQMRRNLQSLMKLERDLQLARQIQQNTFPDTLPRLDGYDLAAWSDPAEETGGDTYDVVGFGPAKARELVEICIKEANQAILLLADATGHGVGPAISVAQVRAMLRMAVRTGTTLELTAHHLNEQLTQDLREGRFVTAWLGALDGSTNLLHYFSAGQAPLLHYRHSRKKFYALEADAPPLGILSGLEIRLPSPIELKRGDIFLVCSDGIFDLKNSNGEAFGRQRLESLILAERSKSASDIMLALRNTLAEFGRGTQEVDDRTAVLIKRTK